jgi:hypothetical protein
VIPRLTYSVIPTRLHFQRMHRMSASLLSHQLFQEHVFECVVFWSTLESAEFPPAESVQTDCSIGKPWGLTCRIAHSLDTFLERGRPWYFRAIDDSWINPDNLFEYLDQLETFVDPYRNLVFKANFFRYLQGERWVEGGSGLLLSRAAVAFIVALNLTKLGEISLHSQEDTALTLPIYLALEKSAQWVDHRFMGPTTGYRTRWIMPEVIREHLESGFRGFNVSCYSQWVYPVKYAVAVHTTGVIELEKLVVRAREVVDDLAMQWNGRTYSLCRTQRARLENMISTMTLRENTPIVVLEDVRNASIQDLRPCMNRWGRCTYRGGRSLAA